MRWAPKKAKRPDRPFKRGDRVRVRAACVLAELVALEATVRRAFWQEAEGGGRAGWVVETDLPFAPEAGMPYRALWADLLKATPQGATDGTRK